MLFTKLRKMAGRWPHIPSSSYNALVIPSFAYIQCKHSAGIGEISKMGLRNPLATSIWAIVAAWEFCIILSGFSVQQEIESPHHCHLVLFNLATISSKTH